MPKRYMPPFQQAFRILVFLRKETLSFGVRTFARWWPALLLNHVLQSWASTVQGMTKPLCTENHLPSKRKENLQSAIKTMAENMPSSFLSHFQSCNRRQRMYSYSRESQFFSVINSLLGGPGQDIQKACFEWRHCKY